MPRRRTAVEGYYLKRFHLRIVRFPPRRSEGNISVELSASTSMLMVSRSRSRIQARPVTSMIR